MSAPTAPGPMEQMLIDSGATGRDARRHPGLPAPALPEESSISRIPPAAHLQALDDFIAATEAQRWKYPGTKERHISAWVRVNAPAMVADARHAAVTRYYQRLNVLLDTPSWVSAHPMLAARLRAHREGA